MPVLSEARSKNHCLTNFNVGGREHFCFALLQQNVVNKLQNLVMIFKRR